KSDFARIRNTESVWIGRHRRDISKCAFRAEGDKFRVKAIFHKSEQTAVLSPAKVKDRPVHAGAAQILGGLFAVPGEDEVMRAGAVFSTADERHPLAIRRDPDIAKRPARSEAWRHGIRLFAVAGGSSREANEKNALGVL